MNGISASSLRELVALYREATAVWVAVPEAPVRTEVLFINGTAALILSEGISVIGNTPMLFLSAVGIAQSHTPDSWEHGHELGDAYVGTVRGLADHPLLDEILAEFLTEGV